MAQVMPIFCPQCGHHVQQQSSANCPKCLTALDERILTATGTQSTPEVQKTNATMMQSLSKLHGRRNLLKGAVFGTVGTAVAGLGAFYGASALQNSPVVKAQNQQNTTAQEEAAEAIASILTVARTAEQLAVTFYSTGVEHASELGLADQNLEYIKAALVEEQIHQQFFTANGGESLTDTFSFPHGEKTFTDLATFIETQQQLEGAFDSAFLAAIKEFALLGRADLAQIAAQVACIEAEHRVLGRAIIGSQPANNWAFTPVLVAKVADAPGVLEQAGYLNPTADNTYKYVEVSTEYPGIEQREPMAVSEGKG